MLWGRPLPPPPVPCTGVRSRPERDERFRQCVSLRCEKGHHGHRHGRGHNLIPHPAVSRVAAHRTVGTQTRFFLLVPQINTRPPSHSSSSLKDCFPLRSPLKEESAAPPISPSAPVNPGVQTDSLPAAVYLLGFITVNLCCSLMHFHTSRKSMLT